MHRPIGIIGGMGPAATADLFTKIIHATPARRDQDHIHVIIDSNPKCPDRAAFLAGRGPDPRPAMIRSARTLIDAGAELLALPCNTAHAFYDDLAAAVSVPVLHMMEEVAAVLRLDYPALLRIGLLGTPVTVGLGLYHRALAADGLEVIVPDEVNQRAVTRAVYGHDGVKAGQYETARAYLLRATDALVKAGAEAIILGCTELPLIINQADAPVPLIDATVVLAQAAVREALRDDRRAEV